MSLNSSDLRPSFFECLKSRSNISIATALLVFDYILLLPLFVFVLFLGWRRWRKRRSAAMATPTSHSDIFTFHMVAVEMIAVLGSFVFLYGVYTDQRTVVMAALELFDIVSPGQTLFHLLTCVERYLAVVHPVTYLGLKQAGGVRIRNISIGCVWLLCLGSVGLWWLIDNSYVIYTFIVLVLSYVAVSFCCLSVLCVLIRPRPGEVGGNRGRVDQSKQRAFYTILAITGVLSLRFSSGLVSTASYNISVLFDVDICLLELSMIWFSLPSSLVLPLLFLHRAGKLPDCKRRVNKPG